MKRLVLLFAFLGSCGGAPRFEGFERLQHFPHPDTTAVRETEVRSLMSKDEWALEDLLALAERINPELEVARREVDFAGTEMWEAGLYPNPSLSYALEETSVSGDRSGRGKHIGSVSIPLVVSGRIGAATDLWRSVREVRALEWEELRLLLRAQIKRAFAEVLYVERGLDLVRELRKVAQEFHDLTEVRFKAGDVAEMEVLKTTVDLSRLDLEYARSEKGVEAAYRALFQLVGNIDLPRKKLVGNLDTIYPKVSFETLRGQALAVHPRLQRALKEKEVAEQEIRLAKVQRWPDLGLSLGFGRDTVEDENFVEGGIEIPLPLFNRNQARIAGAEIRLRQAELRITAARNEILGELAQVFKDYTFAQEAVRRYENEILPAAQKSLDQTNDGYKNRKFSYLDVLDAQRTLFDTRAGYLTAIRDLSQAAADLERLIGGRFE